MLFQGKNKLKWISLVAGLLILIAADIVVDSFLFSGAKKQISSQSLASGPSDGPNGRLLPASAPLLF